MLVLIAGSIINSYRSGIKAVKKKEGVFNSLF